MGEKQQIVLAFQSERKLNESRWNFKEKKISLSMATKHSMKILFSKKFAQNHNWSQHLKIYFQVLDN